MPGLTAPERHDGFVETVAKFLEENGFRVKRRIGCSGCRIDLGVLREGVGAGFALGIECDGPGYAASAASRDRVRLRDSVLAGLGCGFATCGAPAGGLIRNAPAPNCWPRWNRH